MLNKLRGSPNSEGFSRFIVSSTLEGVSGLRGRVIH